MNNQRECRSCKELISKDAKWCPHCHRPQSIIRSIVPPQALFIIIVTLGGYWYLTNSAMENTMSNMANKAIYQGGKQLEITDSSYHFSPTKTGCDSCLYTIGTVKNNTTTAWRSIHFQVTYKDADGKVVDVINDDDTDLVVGPNSEGKFRISGKASADQDSYKTHEIKITKANPDMGWY